MHCFNCSNVCLYSGLSGGNTLYGDTAAHISVSAAPVSIWLLASFSPVLHAIEKKVTNRARRKKVNKKTLIYLHQFLPWWHVSVVFLCTVSVDESCSMGKFLLHGHDSQINWLSGRWYKQRGWKGLFQPPWYKALSETVLRLPGLFLGRSPTTRVSGGRLQLKSTCCYPISWGLSWRGRQPTSMCVLVSYRFHPQL